MPSAMATIKMAAAFHQLYLNFALMGITDSVAMFIYNAYK